MIVDYDKVRDAGYEVIEVEPNIHLIKNFISYEDRNLLMDHALSLPEQSWHEEFLANVKVRCFYTYGTDDLEQLEKDGIFKLDYGHEYQLDKSIGLSYDTSTDSQLSTVSDKTNAICSALTEKLHRFISDGYELSPFNSMRRHYPGDGMVSHTDQKNTPEQRQSCVLYLNDDYLGGELFFTDQEITIKPESCTLAIFNNGIDYMHGVQTVLPGKTRYTLATFISKIV